MCKKIGGILFGCFCTAWFWAASPLASASEPQTDPGQTVSASSLSRLVEISRELEGLNEKLRSELSSSKKSSEKLARTLESSRGELESLRFTLTELERTAATSQAELAALKTAQSEAETSLRNLEVSFTAYREEAESNLSRLERASRRDRFLLKVASALAVSGWGAWLLSR